MCDEIRLIDPAGSIAQGKALDILQSGPVENFNASVTGTDSLHAAAGAQVVVLADSAAGDGEYSGDAALALVRRLQGAGVDAPLVFAGASPREAMKRTIGELHVAPARAIGAAPLALESALRALCGVIADTSGVEVSLSVVGVPPKHAVIAWEEATVSGQPLTSVIGAHEIAALCGARHWPLAAGALCIGIRRRTDRRSTVRRFSPPVFMLRRDRAGEEWSQCQWSSNPAACGASSSLR